MTLQPFWVCLQPKRQGPYKCMENVGKKGFVLSNTLIICMVLFVKLRTLAALIHVIMMASVSSVERMTLNVIVLEDTLDLSANVSYSRVC